MSISPGDIASEKIQEQLLNVVPYRVFQRGQQYYEKKTSVRDIIIEKNGNLSLIISATVRGTELYTVDFSFSLQDGVFDLEDCTCPFEETCKHSVALVLVFADIYAQYCDQVFTEKKTVQNFLKWYKKSNRKTQNKRLEENTEKKLKDKKTPVITKDLLEQLKAAGLDIQTLDKISAVSGVTLDDPTVSQDQGGQEFAKKYKIILHADYRARLEVVAKNKYRQHGYGFYGDPYDDLQEVYEENETEMSQSQRELFDYFFEGDILDMREYDLAMLYEKLLQAQMDVMIVLGGKEKKVRFVQENTDDSQTHIQCKIERQRRAVISGAHQQEVRDDLFYCTLISSWCASKKAYFFYGKTGMLCVHDKDFFYVAVVPEIQDVIQECIARKHGYKYSSGDPLRIRLNNAELIALMKLAKKPSTNHNTVSLIESEFSNYELKEHTKRKKVIAVHYDALQEKLIIMPAIDYGSAVIYLSETVHKVWSHTGDQFVRRSGGASDEQFVLGVQEKEQILAYAQVHEKDEIAMVKACAAKHEKCGLGKMGRIKIQGNKKIIAYYTKYWQELQSLGYPFVFVKDELKIAQYDFKAKFNIEADASNDWLAFDADFYCGEGKVTLEMLKDYIDNPNGYMTMDDGTMAIIGNLKELQKLIYMLESFTQIKDSGTFEGRMYSAPELDDLCQNSQYYTGKMQQSFKRFIKEAKSGKPVEKVKLPTKTKKLLRDYQREGIDWFYFLRKYRFAGILADDMGLGKTIQALTLIDLARNTSKPSLVVCPKTLLTNWEQEVSKFTPHRSTTVIDGSPSERKAAIKKAKKSDIIITSYSVLQRDLAHYQKSKIKFDYCILDEAQMIKNHKTKNAKTVKQIDADYRLALTGTPLENTVSEIWSMFDFLMPGFLGSHQSFQKNFHKPIMQEADLDALARLRSKTSCFMLRRAKADVLTELPPKVEQKVSCDLSNEQSLLYQEVLSRVKSDIFSNVQKKGFSGSQIHILSGLTKLRQICNHPALLLKEKKYEQFESAKLNVFHTLIDGIVTNKSKVLVFSQFTSMIDILEAELTKKGIPYVTLTGSTRKRKDVIEKFTQDEKIPVFLISLKAGGVGLNLTVADNVIIFDPWWNPSVENQAIDRTHRIGQKKSVNVYRLITKGTIEERIVALQERKKNLFDGMVGESKDLFKKLTWQDIQSLFE